MSGNFPNITKLPISLFFQIPSILVLSFLLLFNDEISFVNFSRPVTNGDYFLYGVFAFIFVTF